MRFLSFKIENYRAISDPIEIHLKGNTLIPLIGINECGKTTILQAIFAFDAFNDQKYEGAHLEKTENLYSTKQKVTMLTATLDVSFSELMDIYGSWEPEEVVESDEDDSEESNETGILQYGFGNKVDFNGTIKICRDLTNNRYWILSPNAIPDEYHDHFIRFLLKFTPFILYNDDFQDRPPSRIPIEKTGSPGEWLAIYQQLFKETDPDYSIYNLAGIEDPLTRDSIVSDVQVKLNKTLAAAWKSFQLDSNKKVTIELDYKHPAGETDLPYIDLKVVEKIGERVRYFRVTDRSKGFLWFYNFVMKLEFNPKIKGKKTNTIHLLDEPGCYLHAAAQEKLCAKLNDISKKSGVVIYCTHSHKLLNPSVIPLNRIQIVSKSNKKKINVTALPEFDTSGLKINAIQPVLEALEISPHDFIDKNKPTIAVEGIYDKYVIELFMPDCDKYWLYPGTSAMSIIQTIQLLNAFGVTYVAIWDNDNEGKSARQRAEKLFGFEESKKFDLLPSREGGKKRRMEQMFESSDLELLKKELDLPEESTYESTISALYFSSKSKKAKLIDNIKESTKANFRLLNEIVKKRT